MNYQNVIYEVVGRIARITLNRPEKRNAISWPMLAELSSSLKEAEKDERVRVIIIRGAGPCFSSGHDLSDTGGDALLHKGNMSWAESMASGKGVGVGVSVWDSRAHTQGFLSYSLEIWNNWKPVIAQVHSYCLAAATGIALACDMLIVSDDARLGYPPVRGLAVGYELAFFAWHMGVKKAKELALTGDSLTADEMLHYGVANYVFPRDKLDQETMDIATRIANVDMDLLVLSKRLLNRTFDLMGLTVSLQYGAEFESLGHFLSGVEEFGRIAREKGIKAALEQRDAPFGGIVGRYSPLKK